MWQLKVLKDLVLKKTSAVRERKGREDVGRGLNQRGRRGGGIGWGFVVWCWLGKNGDCETELYSELYKFVIN